ncbi:HEPN domain-containing protein [Arenimonas terrae]|uniref:HEPN domain-containing protein n=1 Tax=Arenimonas terrae TaxID=2546226 RepID=A0A5C4RNY9_9GAMM|nr:HEPN domain-containing protein [Arenimonas terrae]TNJ32644.1 HEPN domain-containing protein [Arenimonas terrae]
MDAGRTTSAGLWRFARDYSVAGGIVANAAKDKYSDPAYFLYGRSIELALKAFLVARGVSYSELRGRAYGHDLVALLRRARRHRLGQFAKISPTEMKALALLNEHYSSKRFEYIVTGFFSVPDFFGIQLFTHQLVSALKDFCIRSTYGKVPA